jgi:hypothetical protein
MPQNRFAATSKKVKVVVILAGVTLVLGAFIVLSTAIVNMMMSQTAEAKESNNERINLAHPSAMPIIHESKLSAHSLHAS